MNIETHLENAFREARQRAVEVRATCVDESIFIDATFPVSENTQIDARYVFEAGSDDDDYVFVLESFSPPSATFDTSDVRLPLMPEE